MRPFGLSVVPTVLLSVVAMSSAPPAIRLFTAIAIRAWGGLADATTRGRAGLEHESPAGAGLAPFLALSGRIPGEPHRPPVTTRLNGLGLVAGRIPALLMLA